MARRRGRGYPLRVNRNASVMESEAQVDAAFRAWRHLTHGERKSVRRLARQGRLHPDPQVAAVAHQWAVTLQSGAVPWWDYIWIVPLLPVDLIIGGIWGSGLPLLDRRERDAKRLLDAEERQPTPM
jgi:hypothetical protein